MIQIQNASKSFKGNPVVQDLTLQVDAGEIVGLYPYLSGMENLDYFCKLAGLNYATSQLGIFLPAGAYSPSWRRVAS